MSKTKPVCLTEVRTQTAVLACVYTLVSVFVNSIKVREQGSEFMGWLKACWFVGLDGLAGVMK